MPRVALFLLIAPLWAAAPHQQIDDAPGDLRPLLVPAPSELRFVVRRYALDRQTLDGNYAGSPERLGLKPADPDPGRVPLSRTRLARLKRFDLDWQAALAGLDPATLSPRGRADLATLRGTVEANLRLLDSDAATLQHVIEPLLPAGPALVAMVEARIAVADPDPRRAAALLSTVPREIAELSARLPERRPHPAHRRLAAAAVTLLARDLDEWFAFYHRYDPLFTWWVPEPFRRAREALDAYASSLRAGADAGQTPEIPATPAVELVPAPRTAFGGVPDLGSLMRLPHDEAIEIVRRFRAGHDAILRDGAGRPAFYRRWLAALGTLDFAGLSRNAQIDYLFLERTCRLQIARAGVALPADPPRKSDQSGIPGRARGRQGLLRDLEDEIISYAPEELLAIAEREFAWVEAEMIRSARQLGFGDDWKRAIEHVKDMHPPPGGQPAAVRDLMDEAVTYLRAEQLLSVPAVAAESLHMVMLTPEQQLINPFFRGGPRISVSYPTDTMTYDQRVQSMRGNNTPFSHATAHHEMIPGHNLDDYTRSRFADYRAELVPRTPFFREGWALYWELLLYERGFHDTPEERIGALFWLMHRCARIVFSLRFHLGEWSPQDAIDYLVDRVGHERDNATAEVRRSFEGSYPPLYQAAYLLGGLQIRALFRELVATGRMTPGAFHDELLRQNAMPIALLRLAVGGERLTPRTALDWRFYGDLK